MLKRIMVLNAKFGILAEKHPRGVKGHRCWTELNRLGGKNMCLTKT